MAIYKPIPGFENKYLASNDGCILSLRYRKTKRKQHLRLSLNTTGYLKVDLQGRSYLVSRLVALTFIPNPKKKPFVNHKNGDYIDNRVSNLEWSTHSENMKHSYNVLGNKSSGKIVLTKEQVLEIYNYGYTKSQRELATMFNVGGTVISKIRTGRNWSTVTGQKSTPCKIFDI